MSGSESMNHKSLLTHFMTRQSSQRLLAEQGFSQDSCLCASGGACVCLWGCVSGGVSTQQQKASARCGESKPSWVLETTQGFHKPIKFLSRE